MDAAEIDLNLLRVMLAVDQAGSVTRAAERLGLSQPAVSAALARLRRSLGDPLFVRSQQGVKATPRARRALESFDAALGLIRQGLRGASFDPAEAEEVFDLLVSDLGEVVYLPSLMRHLRSEAPKVRVRVRQLARGGYAQALEAGLADLAIGHLSKPRGSLRSRRLFTDTFVCLVRAGHPVLEGPLTVERYLGLSHVIITRGEGREGFVAAALDLLGIERVVALTMPHFAAAPPVIASSDLAATVPSHLAEAYRALGIVGVPLPFVVPPINLAMYWHERSHDDGASRWLRDAFVKLFGTPST